jgi:hypothetical protein
MTASSATQAPAPVEEAIPGSPEEVRTLARTFGRLASAADDAGSSVHKHRRQLDDHWRSESAQLAQVVLGDTATQFRHGHHGLAGAAAVLDRYAADLATAQKQYRSAADEIVTLQARLAADPTNTALQNEIDQLNASLQKAMDTGTAAAQRTTHELDGMIPAAFAVKAHGHLDADTALFIDTEVAHHRISRRRGVRAGDRIAGMSRHDRRTINGVLNTAGARGRDGTLSMLGAGKSVKSIDQKYGNAKYFSLQGPGRKLDGKVSWFGGPNDPMSGSQTASGRPLSVPGIAVYNQATLGGYWLVEFPNGKKLVLQQTDIGPAPWTGRKVDVTSSALPAAGYTEGNFPTDSTVHCRYLGKTVPPGVATT